MMNFGLVVILLLVKKRTKKEKDWVGGDALPGDKIIKDRNITQEWCLL